MNKNGFRLKILAGAMLSTGLLLSAGTANADRAIYAANAANTDDAVSSGSAAPGDILLFPYYRAEEGANEQITTLHLVNTSKTDTVVAKIRLREFETSNDGIDFTVIMSPNDVFSGAVKQQNGKTVFVRSSNDTTCTSPVKMGPAEADRTFHDKNQAVTFHTGHIEVITMATFNADDQAINNVTLNNGTGVLSEIVAASTHTDSKNSKSDCVTVDTYFNELKDSKDRFIGTLQDALDDVPVESHLIGHYTIRNKNGGLAAGGRPTTITNALKQVDNDPRQAGLHSPCYVGTTGGDNSIICGQFPKHYKYPSLIHVAGVDVNNLGAAAANVRAFNYFEDTIRAASVANEWSRNDSNGVNSEMIVTFPTKYIYRDSTKASTTGATSKSVFTGAALSGSELVWDDVDQVLNAAGASSASGAEGYFTDSGIDAGCTTLVASIFDREEGTPQITSKTSTSGTPDAEAEVKPWCNEVTVLTFSKNGDASGVTQGGGSAVVYPKSIDDQKQDYGWLRVGFNNQAGNQAKGLPTIGYTMWSRSFGDNGKDFGHIMNNVNFK